jgi:UDP-glucose 4-epimerase
MSSQSPTLSPDTPASAGTVLVTGAAGYIGTHTLVELLAAGYDAVCVDNFCNSSPTAIERVQEISGRKVVFEPLDIRDCAALDRLLARHPVDSVIHFAALKAVGESVAQPLAYYDNNVGGTLSLLAACRRAGVSNFVFSSTATVYGTPSRLPLTEDMPIAPLHPYATSKVMAEQMLRDLCVADPSVAAISLRYFNPIGAHASGLIGEDPRDIPNNLFPFITQVAIGKRPRLAIFGNDWPTPDGTGVRDYLHVVDLARGHVAALAHAARQPGFDAINLGTGKGTSVLQLIAAFEQASGQRIAHEIVARRPGDIAAFWADASRARRVLGWNAQHSLAQACASGWHWQQRNPDGYR